TSRPRFPQGPRHPVPYPRQRPHHPGSPARGPSLLQSLTLRPLPRCLGLDQGPLSPPALPSCVASSPPDFPPTAQPSRPCHGTLFRLLELLLPRLEALGLPPAAADNLCRNYSVRLGENSLEKREDSEQEIEVAQSIPHPCYNSSNNKHDLMLLRLRKPAEVNRNVQPIGLASRCPQPNQECTVSGWGTTTSPRGTAPRGGIIG
uniref:Kallikrein-8 n=1 Tax=Monodelphis domestica TaxID=13616 RepID=A0A5F8G775_MONDO